MQRVVTITAATGKIGRAVTTSLLSKGINVRAIGRNSDKLESLKENGASVFPGDLGETEHLINVFRGSDAVLAIVPDNFNQQDFKAYKNKLASSIVAAIRTAGVPYVAAISSVGADLNTATGPIEALRNLEKQLHALNNIKVVILRPAFIMENLVTLIPIIKSMGFVAGGFNPDTFFPMVSVIDISQAAVEHLSTLKFSGYTEINLLGPHDYTYPEVTSAVGKAIGKPGLNYVQVPYKELRSLLTGAGFSLSGANALIESVISHNEGHIQSTVKRSKENSTPTSIEEFAAKVFIKEYSKEYPSDAV